MKITTLKHAPHLYEATLSLIESSFEYVKPNSFAVDFAPLVDKSNFENCFIALNESENVLAHIGVCERRILGCKVAMIGGIAVDKKHRGEGIFTELLNDVLSEKRSDVAFFLLWSDQEKLYKKFGFHLCGTQIEIPSAPGIKSFTASKLHLMSETQLGEIHKLFLSSFSKVYSTLERSMSDWKLLATVTSADLYLREDDGKITSYFIMNKGQDLSGIIYEYGSEKDLTDLIPELTPYGNVWLGSNFIDAYEMQYQFFLATGDKRLFSEFVAKFTNGKMLIHDLNLLKQEVYFDFNEELLSLDTEDFLRGILGPGMFEEIDAEIRPIFISGLVSI